jgi:hypothetical protein
MAREIKWNEQLLSNAVPSVLKDDKQLCELSEVDYHRHSMELLNGYSLFQ